MTAVPVTRTFVAGEVVLASYFNTNINGPINFLLAKPIVEARQTTLQTVTTGTWTALTFTTEDVDSSGMHSNVTNTSRFTAVYPGWYLHGGGANWVPNSTSPRGTFWSVNATGANGSQALEASIATFDAGYAARSKRLFLNVTDYSELFVYQGSGGNLNTSVNAQSQSSVTIGWDSN